jgi:multiple sugar transport system permease protein
VDGQARSARRLGNLLVAPTLLVLLAVTGYPLVSNVWNSLHRVVLTEPGDPFVGLGNYVQILRDPDFVDALVRTLSYTVVSVALQVAAGVVVALVLHHSFRGRGLVRAAVLIPWAVPTVVAALLWKQMFDPRSGFVNYLLGALHLPGAETTWLAGEWTAWVAIFVADSWKTVPFVAILLLAGLQVIPGEIYEAGTLDGAGRWQAFWHLTLPLLRPALLTALVFRVLQSFLIFDVVFAMTGGGPGASTETVTFLNWQAFLVRADFGVGGATSVLIVLLSLVLAGASTLLVGRPKEES